MKLAIATALAAFLAVPALAQCGPHADVVKQLREKYKETVQMRGLDNGGRALEMFASESGSWTAVLTSPDGTACIVSHGEAFGLVTEPQGVSL